MLGLLMTLVVGVFAQPWNPPIMQCVQPMDGGRIKFIWSCDQNDCLHFKEYCIYVNSTLQRTINASPGETLCDYGDFIISVPNASSYDCYMIAYDSNNYPYPSNTIRSINLTVTPNVSNTRATLNWSPPTTSFDNTWGTSFDIYKKRGFETSFPTQPFASIPRTAGTSYSYIDISDVCNDDISYQVGITHSYQNGSPCPFMSSIITVSNLTDDTPPTTPVIDSVSVTSNNKVMIGFHETEPYMRHFIIDTSSAVTGPYYQKTTITGGLTYWIDPSINPSSNTKYYRVRAVDSCNNTSPMTDSLWNMKLSLLSTDVCLKSASFNWSKNDRPIKDIDHYEVNLSDDGGATWRTIGTTTDNSYKIENLNYNQNYTVLVRAANSDRTLTASSNRINFTIPKPNIADFSYIPSVSVIDNQYIQINALTRETPQFESITLQRSEDGIQFEDFKTQSYITGTETYVFDDKHADFERKTYYYRTFLTNSCKTSSGYSNISHNIVLRGENDPLEQTNLLTWNGYDNWDGDVADYTIMRKLERQGFNTVTYVVPAINNYYLDNISQFYESGAKFTYYIEAKEGPNQYGIQGTSCSNHLTITQPPTLYIPNAFRPFGGNNNNVFKPANLFVSYDQYRFSIFSRTGECLFITTNPHEGWNGRKNNNPHSPVCPENVYVYHIEYQLPDGTIMERSGTVTLLK